MLGMPAFAHAQASCEEAAPANAGSAGRPQLAQGIALFESRDLAQAERALQAALFAGLADPMERASAHKYLAYTYCTHKEWTRCEAAFDSAFSAHPGFALQAYETTDTPWRDAYSRAQERRTRRCPAAPQLRAASAAGSFTLNSRVITSITALASGPVRPAASAARYETPRTDHNLRLKVSPWANVLINGKPSGVTPPVVLLKLAPGSHTVELRNPGFESYRQVIRITDGQSVTLSHDFDAR
jgi:hypothetical protein